MMSEEPWPQPGLWEAHDVTNKQMSIEPALLALESY
jgi:hypothetical protein